MLHLFIININIIICSWVTNIIFIQDQEDLNILNSLFQHINQL